jgi:putative oxidoreductase
MASAPGPGAPERIRALASTLFGTEPSALGTDIATLAMRIALVWIFIYYGAGKLFGAFNGLGIHGTALYFSNTAHLHPGGLFAVVGGVIEFGGGIAMAFGFAVRLAGIALFGDMVMAMITVTWSTGLDSAPGYQVNLALCVLALVMVVFGAGRFSLDAVAERHLVGVEPSRAG